MFIFLYAPILALAVFSFNDSKSMGKWEGFTLKWYESLFQDDFNSYTRPWFAWTNSLFGDMLIDLMHRHPDYILKNSVVS